MDPWYPGQEHGQCGPLVTFFELSAVEAKRFGSSSMIWCLVMNPGSTIPERSGIKKEEDSQRRRANAKRLISDHFRGSLLDGGGGSGSGVCAAACRPRYY